MIQEIFPHQFHNEFQIKAPLPESFFFYFQSGSILLKNTGSLGLPSFQDLENPLPRDSDCDYLFSIDEKDYFLIDEEKISLTESRDLKLYETRIIRDLEPRWVSFAAANASQLRHFYQNSRFCGCCGKPMIKSRKERSLVCS